MKGYESRFAERVEKIRRDSVHGASYLTVQAAEALKELALGGASVEELRSAAVAVSKSRPMMASVFRLANDLLFFLQKEREGEEVAAFCDDFAGGMHDAVHAASRFAAAYASNARILLTHSYSTAVERTLKRLLQNGKRPQVLCTESRPGYEGTELARTLCEAGIETTLVIDAAAPYLCDRAELVLLGADGIGSFGLVHKIGTYAIALAAKEYGVEVAAIAAGTKFWPAGIREIEEPPKSSRVLNDGECFGALNLYFDKTPLAYVESVITENGILNSKEAAAYCRNIPLHPLLAAD
ncbi:translation initiation factor eIF-2B [Hydrogenimonas sp.]